MNGAFWYLVFVMASELAAPSATISGQRPMLGPFTESECVLIEAKVAHDFAGSIVSVKCRKAIGAYACEVPGRPWTGMSCSCPLFEGDIYPLTTSPPKP